MRLTCLIESLENRQFLSAGSLSAKSVRVDAVEGQAFTQVSVATLKDKTPEATGAYAVTIAWGDGSSSAGTVVADGNGGFVVDGSHAYVARGKYKTAIVVTETDGNTAHAAGMAKIQNAAITVTGRNVSGIAGLAIQGVFATYTDADALAAGPVAGQVAIIRWGDKTSSTGTLTLNTTTHRIEVSGKHSYAKAGTFTISTLVREPTVVPTIATSTATIAVPVPVLTPTLVGDFVGTAKAGGGGGLLDGIIGDVVGAQTFEFNMTEQKIDALSGSISIAGADITGDFTGSLLNNRRFHFALSDAGGSIDIFGRITTDGSIISGRLEAKYSGVKFKGDFSGTRQ